MDQYLLSICIPTYNFGKFIEQALKSVVLNLVDGVEVVIFDGGSTDDTSNIVSRWQYNYPQVKYFRQEFRGGIDRDIAKTVSIAQGVYCWLFSADDIMMPGAISKVVSEIQSNCDIYLCEHISCNYDMTPIEEHPIFHHITTPEIFNLGDVLHRQRYFSNARTSEAFFSFLSGPIFKKDIWERADCIPESFYGTCWGLAGRLLSMAQHGLIIKFLAEKLLYKRGDNDSFRENGLVNRLQISVEGFVHIGETIFGKNSFELYHIRRVIRNEWTLRTILSIKLLTAVSPKKENIDKLNSIVSRHYLDAGVFNLFKYIIYKLATRNILNNLRIIYRISQKSCLYLVF